MRWIRQDKAKEVKLGHEEIIVTRTEESDHLA